MKALTAVLATLVVGLSATGAVTAESASAKTLPTSVALSSVLLISTGQYQVTGKIDSSFVGCRAERVVRLYLVHADNTTTVTDTRKTKAGPGLFTFRAFLAPREGLFVTAPAKQFRLKSGKRIRCAAATTAPVYPAH